MERLRMLIQPLTIIYMILIKRSLFRREVTKSYQIFNETIKVIEITEILIKYIWVLMEVNWKYFIKNSGIGILSVFI